MGLISLRETYQTVSPYSSIVPLRNGRCQALPHSQPIDSRIGIRTRDPPGVTPGSRCR